MDNYVHVPVLLNECINGLNIKPHGVYFDGTLGGAGHSYEILKRSSPDGRLIATDLDDYAIGRAEERLKDFDGRFNLVKSNFKNFAAIKEEYGVDGFDGILLDLGVSSFQLDDRSRGFSYLSDETELDMRMGKDNPLSAKDIVNGYDEKRLKEIFAEYGEERFAAKIAAEIVKARATRPLNTVGDLNKIIFNCIPQKFQHDGHPSKRVFQALRIEVNGELDGLYEAVTDLVRGLKKGGKICIITFHSLEDRIVKNTFKSLADPCTCPKSFPVCVCGKKPTVRLITNKPITAGEAELNENPRARSALLRICEGI